MGRCKSSLTIIPSGLYIDMSRYVWWARKSADASNNGNPQDPVLDDEILESDEDEQHEGDATKSTNVTNVPLPTTTDATQASVEQLSALAVSSKDDDKQDAPAS
jgi:hypothetical protein